MLHKQAFMGKLSPAAIKCTQVVTWSARYFCPTSTTGGISPQIFIIKVPNIKLRRNPSSASRADNGGQAEAYADVNRRLSQTCEKRLPADRSADFFFFFFNRHYNPSWVSACSTVAELSQQEGFTECRCQRHVKSPTWRRRSADLRNRMEK
jgi:hypothetical protein